MGVGGVGNSRKFQKLKLQFVIGNYLHNVCIIFGIVSDVKIPYRRMNMVYIQMLCHIIEDFGVLRGFWNQPPAHAQGRL